MLDVTRSPYVAAYFAFEDEPPEGTASAIWAIDSRWCARRSGAEALKHVSWMAPAVDKSFELTDGIVERELLAAMKLLEPLGQPDTTLGVMNPGVLPYEPVRIGDRMSVQQGLFVWPANVELSFMDNLRSLGDLGGIKKITVPSSLVRGRALEQLRLMNITRASLFGGIDGFAQSFRQLLVKETPEQRARRGIEQGNMGALEPSRRLAAHLAATSGSTGTPLPLKSEDPRGK